MNNFRFAFLLSLVLLAHGADDLIGKVCQGTPDSKLCETTLRSDPRSSGANTEGLVHIIIDAVKSKFSDSLSYVKGQMKGSPEEKALKECARRFGVVLDADVPVAESALEQGNPKFGENSMRDSAVEAEACQKAVTGGSYNSELIERTKHLNVLSNVAASLFKALE